LIVPEVEATLVRLATKEVEIVPADEILRRVEWVAFTVNSK
jgi:hypothetical protein